MKLDKARCDDATSEDMQCQWTEEPASQQSCELSQHGRLSHQNPTLLRKVVTPQLSAPLRSI